MARKLFRVVTFHWRDPADRTIRTEWTSKTEATLLFRHRVFDPNATARCYVLERSDGRETEFSERNFELARIAHDEALAHRDAVGVWG